jgi:NAD(P)-dependent dehydrogenase (short-subunit alcohol dehydrogenase family)
MWSAIVDELHQTKHRLNLEIYGFRIQITTLMIVVPILSPLLLLKHRKESNMALDGKVVAISGAAGGLGATVARVFADAGASLAVSGRELPRLTALLDSLGLPPDRALATAVDLADPEAAKSWARAVMDKLGRLDVVIHLVGGYRGGTSIAEIPVDDWAALSESLAATTLNVARAFVGPLKAGGWGRFIVVSSPFARKPEAKKAVYSMAKAAQEAMVLALADELSGSGATANAISVRTILTPEDRAKLPPGKPLGKVALAEEIASAMLYLCSDEARALNGAVIPLTARG